MPDLAALNALPCRDFEELLLGCCAAPGEHYHVPLLLAPFGYATYRGS